jgi:phage recombination protein Bet
MNAIVKHGFDQEQVKLIKATIMSGKSTPTDNDLALFGMICQKAGLDPFAKQIFAIERGGKWTFQISVDGLRAIADRTGVYAGSDEPLYDEGLDVYEFEETGRNIPKVCKVTVWKIVQGQRCPFVGVARYSDFCQSYNGKPSGLWEKMPSHMLAKCAETQALRKAFPQCNQITEQVEAIPVQPVIDEQWRVDGYQWGISQGVSPETAAEIAKVAKDKKDLAQRLKSAIPEAVEVATLQRHE